MSKINFENHFLSGEVWEVPSASNPKSMNKVTMGPNGFWCDCKHFSFYSRCPHTGVVENKILGIGIPNWSVPA